MINVNSHIEQAIRGIETERDQQISIMRETIMREKVVPQNAEIDQKRDLALSELQEKYAAERQAIIDASEKQKTDNANALINAETASIAYEYDAKIAELKKLKGE